MNVVSMPTSASAWPATRERRLLARDRDAVAEGQHPAVGDALVVGAQLEIVVAEKRSRSSLNRSATTALLTGATGRTLSRTVGGPRPAPARPCRACARPRASARSGGVEQGPTAMGDGVGDAVTDLHGDACRRVEGLQVVRPRLPAPADLRRREQQKCSRRRETRSRHAGTKSRSGAAGGVRSGETAKLKGGLEPGKSHRPLVKRLAERYRRSSGDGAVSVRRQREVHSYPADRCCFRTSSGAATAPGAPGPGQGLRRRQAGDEPRGGLPGNRHQRDELNNQMEAAEGRASRHHEPAQRRGADQHRRQGGPREAAHHDRRPHRGARQAARQADAQVASAASVPGAIVERPPDAASGAAGRSVRARRHLPLRRDLPISIAPMPVASGGAARPSAARLPHDIVERFTQIDQAVESIAVEVERIGEGQRFVTRVLSEGGPAGLAEQAPRGPSRFGLARTADPASSFRAERRGCHSERSAEGAKSRNRDRPGRGALRADSRSVRAVHAEPRRRGEHRGRDPRAGDRLSHDSEVLCWLRRLSATQRRGPG